MSFGQDRDFKEAFDHLYGSGNAVVANRSDTSATAESATNGPAINVAELLKSIPVFKKGDNLCNFVNEIDRLFDQISEKLTPDVRFLIIAFIKSYKLKGEPRDVCEGEIDWSHIKRVLLKKYGDKDENLKKKLSRCAMNIGDSYLDFYYRILEIHDSLMQLANLYSKDLSDANFKISEYNKLAVETFKNGLFDPYKEYLSRFDLSTLEECKKKCLVLESKHANSVKSQDSLPLSINVNRSNGEKSSSQQFKSRMPKTSANGNENCIPTLVDDKGNEIPYVKGKKIYLRMNNSMVVDDEQEKIYFFKKDGEKFMGLTKDSSIIIFDKEYEIETMMDGIVPGTEICIKKTIPIEEDEDHCINDDEEDDDEGEQKVDLKYERVRVLYSKGDKVMGLSEDNRLILTRDKDKINIDRLPGIPGKFIYLDIKSPWMRNPQYEKVRVLHEYSHRRSKTTYYLTEDFRVISSSSTACPEISPGDLQGVQDEIFIRRKSVFDPQYERVRVFIQEGNVILGTTEDNRVIVTGIQNANKLIIDPDSPFPSTVMTFNRTSEICITHCLKYCDYIAGLLNDQDISMNGQNIEIGRQEQLPVSDQMFARNSAQAAVELQNDELPDVKDQYIYLKRNSSMTSDDMYKMYFVEEKGNKIMGLTKNNRVVIIDEKYTINTRRDKLVQSHKIYIKNPPMDEDLVFDRIRVFYRTGGNIMGLSEDNRVVFMREKEKFSNEGRPQFTGQADITFVESNSPWMREPQYEKVFLLSDKGEPIVGLTEDCRVIHADKDSEFIPDDCQKVQNVEIFIKKHSMVDNQYDRVHVFIQEGNVILGTTEDNRVIVTGIQNANKLINDPDSPFPSTVMTFNKTSDICVSHCLQYFSNFLSLCAKPTISKP